jgi:hypothetical protein
MNRTIGTILCLLIIFSAISVTFAAQVGSTSYGYVTKEVYGNQSSNDTITIIIGVHPQENGIHKAILNAIKTKSSHLNKKYVIYKVHVTKNANDYKKGRMNGQLLAQKFIVHYISRENPILVVDFHENHYKLSGYKYSRFVDGISKTTLTRRYINTIINQMHFLSAYAPPNPTSTKYVTIPIANKGINTIVYETYMHDSFSRKLADAKKFLNILDSKAINIPQVIAKPVGGTYNAPKSIILIVKSGSIYYTLNGTIPTNNSRLYTGPININSTTVLKFISIDKDNKSSQVFTEKYVIDKIHPKINSTNPKNGAKGFSRTATISIKFTENIKSSINWSKIYIKNLKTGKKVGITKTISGNTLKIKINSRRSAYTTYQVYIPASAMKDLAGNNLVKFYSFKFKTGKY